MVVSLGARNSKRGKYERTKRNPDRRIGALAFGMRRGHTTAERGNGGFVEERARLRTGVLNYLFSVYPAGWLYGQSTGGK